MNTKISYNEVGSFSKLALDYINHNDNLSSFVNYFPKIENFGKQIIERKNYDIDRQLLYNVLKKQYFNLLVSEKTNKNIELLKLENTFTITTGHQLCLFTGPLYFFYKIVSTLNLCDQLTEKYSKNNFVPVFWMASEDHDFHEINHIDLFGKKIEWRSNQSGPVGEFNLNDFHIVLEKLKLIVGNSKHAEEIIEIFEKAYLGSNNLADATRYIINEFFGKYGLVIIDGNNKDLKNKLIPLIKKDNTKNGFFNCINDCTNNLMKNYHAQAFVRKNNFFKLSLGERKLIVAKNSEKEIEQFPERFSPNVLLRPLYQELLLPNVAFVGGGSEIAYWLQLKSAFSQENIPFPILVIRNSALLVDLKHNSLIKELGFNLYDLFLSEDELVRKYLSKNSEIDFSLSDDKNNLDFFYSKLELKFNDQGFKDSINASHKKHLNFLKNLEERMIRTEKKNHSVSVNRIRKIRRLLFPNNQLQERTNSFIPYYLKHGEKFIKKLRENFVPLSKEFIILTFND